MRKFLIVIALGQTVFLAWAINSKLTRFTDAMTGVSDRDDRIVHVNQMLTLGDPEIEVSNMTPGFVEGYIAGKYNEQIHIDATYSKRGSWSLQTQFEGITISAESNSLQSACLEVLDEFHKIHSSS